MHDVQRDKSAFVTSFFRLVLWRNDTS